FVKCNPTIIPGPTTKSNLKYISTDSSAYTTYYEIKSDYGWNELIALCDTVTNHASGIGSVMDMDRAIWMLAFNNVLVNLDSYSGVFCQNHYLYKDSYGYFNSVIWDLNMCLGGFPFAGSGATSLGSLNVTAMEQLPLNLHSADIYWPLINTVFNNPMYKRMFIAHTRTITSEMFASNLYQSSAASLQALVDTAVQSDSNKFFTYAQFQNGMTSNTIVGSYTVPGISNLMSARVTYLQGTTDFSYTPPTIIAVTPSNSSPLINTNVTITATVTNTNSNAVYLGYRFQNPEKFTRVLMYDDGTHNDGAAGDNAYGASFLISSAQTQYYIYAENNNAGLFSPERAEHEFHTLLTNVQTAVLGQVVLNEFLADNIAGDINENSQNADWIELFNNTNSPLDLFGLYLTDNFLSQQKFTFPQNTIIPANGYRIIWADENNSTASYVHCNFRLAATGEQLMLSNAAGTVLDSITFGTQTSDVALARCPNGTGPFTSRIPTFGTINCPVGVEELSSNFSSIVYPNPANDLLRVKFLRSEKINALKIYSASGQIVFEKNISSPETIIDLSKLPAGFYLLRVNETGSHKIQIVR
ncbi:MAG TPA: CotH kinase family protein, partial [Bacteroidia bacterium]|nr:CotH kinase family protein [Bacteroidia bacterium]